MERVTHTLDPVYDTDSKILILGTMPSVKSREEGFYYAHPGNRFWAVLGCVFSCDCPVTVNQKKEFLKTHHIALWDVLQSCEIHGSGDASIRNIVTNPVEQLLPHTKITGIYTTGKKAYEIYEK
ncbi:MAG: DNA-deoxyinosine glycosylase, partial [Erysipelotrichaceae bacterium]|nr:DNA-deoxyinosine glycosylase [Erysipelotrichaceae bacterium]